MASGMREIRNIVVLTGAGISAKSGLATFRGPDGLWEGHRVEDLSPCPSQGALLRLAVAELVAPATVAG